MKTKLVTLFCAVAFGWCSTTSTFAGTKDPVDVAADALLVRPACIVSAAVGSVLWVVALPFTLPSKSVKSTAKVLIDKPIKAAFVRPLGDIDGLAD
jgi:hypothetical protein